MSDVLKFRKALTYMDLEHPFGESFGRASNRDELIKSSHAVYQNLLKLVPGSSILPNSILLVLAEKDDGTIDKEMKKSIVSLFRANAGQEISLLSFVQTCDTIYKKLRYFRASVGNSSVIDRVLENVIDAFFGFGLAMVILSILNFNPWPLLVSISTLLVSLAFAIGPTAAKTIEVRSSNHHYMKYSSESLDVLAKLNVGYYACRRHTVSSPIHNYLKVVIELSHSHFWTTGPTILVIGL